MSTTAFAEQAPRFRHPDTTRTQPRRHKKRLYAYEHLPWDTVALRTRVAQLPARFNGYLPRPPQYVWWLAAAALLLHGTLAWYVSTHPSTRKPPPKVQELTLDFVRPKPPEPKIEPPKPPPPKPQVKKPAQVLPPIQQAVPEPSDIPTAAPVEAPVAVAPVAAEPAPAPEPETQPVGRAGYLNNPPPDYPPAAARQGWQGTVTLRVRVLSNGTVESVEIQKSSGRRVLDDEAVRTVKKWLFTPARRGETAIDGWASVPIEFSLEQ